MSNLRVGLGYDVHRLAPERKLILGGVTIPFELGLLGHSDADALCHAICDSLLGALALGDIGSHFPDTDPHYAGISSLLLLKEVGLMIKGKGYSISNVDTTIVMQKPKLQLYLPEMRENISTALAIKISEISIKATTSERMGFVGRSEGVAVHAVVLLQREKLSESPPLS